MRPFRVVPFGLIFLAACHHDSVDSAVPVRAILAAVTPGSFGPGDTVTLTGNALAPAIAGGGRVLFGGVAVTPLPGASDELVRVIAPPCLPGGPMEIEISAGVVSSNSIPASYIARSAPLNLAPYQSVTVSSAALGTCLTLPGDGSTYLVIGEFAAVGDPTDVVNWQIGTAAASASAAVTASAVHGTIGNRAERDFENTLRGIERAIAPRVQAEMAARATLAASRLSAATASAAGARRAAHVQGCRRGRWLELHVGDGPAGVHRRPRAAVRGHDRIGLLERAISGARRAVRQGSLCNRHQRIRQCERCGPEWAGHRVLHAENQRARAVVRMRVCGLRDRILFRHGSARERPQLQQGRDFLLVHFPIPPGTFSCPHTAASVLQVVSGTFLHQVQHMISFNQHVLLRGGAPGRGVAERGARSDRRGARLGVL